MGLVIFDGQYVDFDGVLIPRWIYDASETTGTISRQLEVEAMGEATRPIFGLLFDVAVLADVAALTGAGR